MKLTLSNLTPGCKENGSEIRMHPLPAISRSLWQDNSESMHPASDQHGSDIKPQVSTSLTGCVINCFGTGGGEEEIFPKPCLNVLPQLMNVSKWKRTEI